MFSRLPSPLLCIRLLIVLGFSLLAACQLRSGVAEEMEYAPDRVLVGLVEPLPEEDVARRLAPLHFRVLRSLLQGKVYLVGLPEGMTVKEALPRLQALPWVRYAEPDQWRRPHGSPR